jgi:hypothetical protein
MHHSDLKLAITLESTASASAITSPYVIDSSFAPVHSLACSLYVGWIIMTNHGRGAALDVNHIIVIN